MGDEAFASGDEEVRCFTVTKASRGINISHGRLFFRMIFERRLTRCEKISGVCDFPLIMYLDFNDRKVFANERERSC